MRDEIDPPAPAALPAALNVDANIRAVVPSTVSVQDDLPALQRHGVRLAWGVMAMIGIFGLVLIMLVGSNEFLVPPQEVATVAGLIEKTASAYTRAASGADALKQANDLMMRLTEARRASRDFWTSFSQFLLLNLLLPVLTAILGYVFGTMKRDDGPA